MGNGNGEISPTTNKKIQLCLKCTKKDVFRHFEDNIAEAFQKKGVYS